MFQAAIPKRIVSPGVGSVHDAVSAGFGSTELLACGFMPNRIGDRRFQLFHALLGLFEPGRVVDLGAGHGLFSVRAADAGWDVTAIDARTGRFKSDPRIRWIEQDVRDSDLSGYDLILCLGLFYHLTIDDQLALLEKGSGTPMILDTHVATEKRMHFPLSDFVSCQGYQGRYYLEEDQTRPQAAWKNDRSFWPTPPALDRMLGENGYASVFTATPWYRPNRTFFLCLAE